MTTRKIGNVFLIGPMGAGKSSIGHQLSKKLKCDFFDSDTEIEKTAGTNIAWIFDVEGEEGLRKREIKAIADLTQLQNIVLATGGGSVLREENRRLLAARGTVVYLRLSIKEQLKRTTHNREKRPLLMTDNLEQRIITLAKQREPLYEEIADIHIDTDTYSVANVTEKIFKYLQGHIK